MKKNIKVYILAVIDIILVSVSILFAYLLRFDCQFASIPSMYLEHLPHAILAATVLKIPIFWIFKLYSSLWMYAGTYEMVSVVEAAFTSNVILFGYTFLDDSVAPRSIFIITMLIDILLIGGNRFAYRSLRRVARGELARFKGSKRVMIVGAGDAGAIVIKELKRRKELRSTPVAVMDDDPSKVGKKLNGIPILGGRESIVRVAREREIDEIIIAIPSAGRKVINKICEECLKTNCKIKTLPGVSQLINGTVTINKIREVKIEDLLGREPVKVDTAEIAGKFSGQSILVTGGGGSIGSELCRQVAVFRPKKLILLDNYENSVYEVQNELLSKYPGLNLEIVIANIRERQRLEQIFRKHRPNVVFHAAAHKHVPLMEANPIEAIRNNIFGTMNVVECADKYGADRFVLISTDKAVNPTNVMGATKRVAEIIIQAYNKHSETDYVAVRFGNVLGSNGSVIPLFRKQIEQGGPVTVTHPEIIRYFMTIPEAVQLVMQAGAMAEGGEIFVLDMGEPVKIYDLAKNLIKLSGFEPEEDIEIVFTGLRPGEKLFEELLLAEEGLEATKNEKIFVAKPLYTDLNILKREIEILNETILDNIDQAVEYMKRIVPTYIPSSAYKKAQ